MAETMLIGMAPKSASGKFQVENGASWIGDVQLNTWVFRKQRARIGSMRKVVPARGGKENHSRGVEAAVSNLPSMPPRKA